MSLYTWKALFMDKQVTKEKKEGGRDRDDLCKEL